MKHAVIIAALITTIGFVIVEQIPPALENCGDDPWPDDVRLSQSVILQSEEYARTLQTMSDGIRAAECAEDDDSATCRYLWQEMRDYEADYEKIMGEDVRPAMDISHRRLVNYHQCNLRNEARTHVRP